MIIKTIGILLLFAMLVGNFYAVRQIKNYGLQAYFYQRMLVAYEVGAMRGLKEELARALTEEKFRKQLVLAKEFEKNLSSIKDPQQFLETVLAEKIKKINLFQEIRNLAILLILILLIVRLLLKRMVFKR